MPYVKNSSSSEGYSRGSRRKSFKKNGGYKGKNQMSTNVRAIVRQELSRTQETKYIKTQQSEVLMNTLTNAYIFSLDYPLQGVGPANRIGNQIEERGIAVKTLYQKPAGDSVWVRQLLLMLKEGGRMTDSVALSVLFESTASGVTGNIPASGTMQDIIRKTNREEITVLRDEIVKLGSQNGNADCQWTKHYIKYPHGTMASFTNDPADVPVTPRFVMVCLPLEADGDEGLGQNVELSYVFDYYFRDN